MGCCENELKIYAVTEFVEGGNLKEVGHLTPTPIITVFVISNLLHPLLILLQLILKSITTSKPIKWRLRISFAEDCARALAYLHARQIIHRDLKSENLLLTANKRIKVCDFGLSRETPRNVEERRRLSFCGTDAYMAPEIVLGMPFDTSVDIFSFGIILLELIFGVVGDAPGKRAGGVRGGYEHCGNFINQYPPPPNTFLRSVASYPQSLFS